MKRSVSFYESRIGLNEDQLAEIRKHLNESADAFIDKATLAGGEYLQLAAAWSGPSPADVRKSIEELRARCASVADAIDSLPDAAPGLIRQAQALDVSNAPSTEIATSMATEIGELQTHLRRIESACLRATKFKLLNQGQGNTSDDARRRFIAQLGKAYTEATGKQPARRSSGQFARVAKILLTAAGADSGLSSDLLVSLFGPSGK